MTQFARIFPRANRIYSPLGLAGGRTLPVVDPAVGYIDAELPDAHLASGSPGYLPVALGCTVGPTSSRPASSPENVGRLHLDTSISAVVIYVDGGVFKNVLTGAAA